MTGIRNLIPNCLKRSTVENCYLVEICCFPGDWVWWSSLGLARLIARENFIVLLNYLLAYLLTYLITFSLTPWCRILFERLSGSAYQKYPAFFMEPVGSSPCSQKPTTGPYLLFLLDPKFFHFSPIDTIQN